MCPDLKDSYQFDWETETVEFVVDSIRGKKSTNIIQLDVPISTHNTSTTGLVPYIDIRPHGQDIPLINTEAGSRLDLYARFDKLPILDTDVQVCPWSECTVTLQSINDCHDWQPSVRWTTSSHFPQCVIYMPRWTGPSLV